MSGTITGETYAGSVTLAPGQAITYPLSKKLVILREITTLLEGVTQANGYEFNLSPEPDAKDGRPLPRVYRGRAIFGSDTPVPCVSILEGPVGDREPRVVGLNDVLREDDWPLFVQGWADTPDDHPTDPCYQLMAAVEKRLSEIISTRKSGQPVNPDAYMLGKKIAGFAIGPGVVRPPQDQVSSKAFFYLPCIVRLPVDVTQPFVAA